MKSAMFINFLLLSRVGVPIRTTVLVVVLSTALSVQSFINLTPSCEHKHQIWTLDTAYKQKEDDRSIDLEVRGVPFVIVRLVAADVCGFFAFKTRPIHVGGLLTTGYHGPRQIGTPPLATTFKSNQNYN